MRSPKFVPISFFLLVVHCTCQEFTVTPITTSSGLYYEKIGEVLLSNNNWQFITSVDYQGYLLFYEYLFSQANKIQEFCQTVKLKECDDRYEGIKSSMRRIAITDDNMANFLGIESHKRRVKRFWAEAFLTLAPHILKPVGQALAGRIAGRNKADLEMYNSLIAQLQNGQKDLENNVNMLATAFKADSEKKDNEIQWLQKTQNEIKDKIDILEGTFTSDSEEKARQIKDLQDMLAETNTKIKMQEEVQNKLVKDVEEIKVKLNSIDDDIKHIYNEIAKNKADINLLELKVRLNTLSINFNFLLTEFEIKQKELFDVIKKANKGDLDPYILTPLRLVQMLENIQPMLPEGTKFPLYPRIENAHKLYNIIKPIVYLYDSKIFFILTIPLVNSKTFNILKMTSVPVPLGKNKFAFILPRQPYLVVDKNDLEYTLLSYQNFREFCRDLTKGTSLCEQSQQTSSVLQSHADCELQLYLNSREIPSSCNKRVVSLEKPVFLQLQKSNSWIYTVPDSFVLTFTCSNKRENVQVTGSGFINSNCSIRTHDSVIQSIAKFSKPVLSTYSPHPNLIDFLDTSNIENVETKKLQSNKINFAPFDFDELKDISYDIKEIPEGSMAAGYYVVIIGGIVIVIVLLLLVLFRRRLTRNNKCY